MMIWRLGVGGALTLLVAGTALAQAPSSYPLETTQHTLTLGTQTLSYTAAAGLMPIRSADGAALIADMSYVAYSMPPKSGEIRPVAFIWNGGSGANATPLHYGAFGPRRLSGGAMKPNEATLLDVADIVFIDQIETGFGRYAAGISHRPFLTQQQDARAFGTFIETYLQEHGGLERPTFLVGESYGVRRAQLVAEDLLKRDVAPEALILISGYILVGKRLEPMAEGALRLPGYSALAFARGRLGPSDWRSEAEVHEAALIWSRRLFEKIQAGDPSVEIDFADGLKRFLGYSDAELETANFPLPPTATPRALSRLAERHAPLIFSDIWNPIAYDLRRWKSDNREWISQAIIDDLRKDLGFNPPGRIYIGQERDAAVRAPLAARTEPMKVRRADGAVVELTPDNLDQFPELKGVAEMLANPSGARTRPIDDGLATSLVNFDVHFGASLSLARSPMPALMAAAPKMELFVIGGIYDDLVSCAVGAEMTRRDLARHAGRVRNKCYAGGHMMYEDEAIAAELSDDVRIFIRNVQAGGAVTP